LISDARHDPSLARRASLILFTGTFSRGRVGSVSRKLRRENGMDYVEQEETQIYQPNVNAYISNPFGTEENYGLFSVKNDKVKPFLINDDEYDVDDGVSNLEMHRRWIEMNRKKAMERFGITEWEPDLTF
jgi:hypothetical protein